MNQPERVFLNSFDDYSVPHAQQLWPIDNAKYNQFLVKLPNPILMPERSQLLRATIPNIQLNIPDYQLVFVYAKQDKITNAITYHNVRLLPSFLDPLDPTFVIPSGLPVNRQIVNYQDLLVLLNQAAGAVDDALLNPTHVQNDIVFAFDNLTRQFSFAGQDTANYLYFPVGYDWEGLDAYLNGILYRFPGQTPIPQPHIPQTTLNLRVGYVQTSSNNPANGVVLPNRAQQYGPSENELLVWPADTFADLVYSQNCYVLANYVQGSSLGSGGQRNLLATVPLAAPPLGVSIFNAPLVNWLTKIAKEIYEIQITLLDDNYQPFLLPNSAIVNVDLGFSYFSL